MTDFTELFGTFECSTRSGGLPLWIINASSVDDIRNISGYARTYYEYHDLPGEGTILSFLFIPVSNLTNNSKVICGATGNNKPVAFSDPVYLIVLPKGKYISYYSNFYVANLLDETIIYS